MERYNRHIILKEIGEKGQSKLQESSVLIIGAGGLGSPVSLYLTAAGVGRIGLIDADTVSESNLQRQILYSENEIGLPKVDCAEKRLHQLSSHTRIETYNTRFDSSNADELVLKYDIIIDGCDNYATRYLINDCCIRNNKPYVYGSIGEFHGQVAVFNYRGGFTYRDLYPDEETLTGRPQTVAGVMGVVPGIIGTMQAAEAIKIITGCGKVLRNRLLTIDVLTMEITVFEY